MGLSYSPLFMRCGAQDETSAHILCECEALASFRHVYLGSFLLEPEDIKSTRLGTIWNFGKGNRAPMNRNWAQRPRQLRPRCIGAARSRTQLQINQSINQGMLSAPDRNTEEQRQSSQCVFHWEFWGASCKKGHLMKASLAFQVLIHNYALTHLLVDFLWAHQQHFYLILAPKRVRS
jgi:hypothetical protein